MNSTDTHEAQLRKRAKELRTYVYPDMFLTGFELIWVLKECGERVKRFAEWVERSENYIRQSLGYDGRNGIPLVYYKALEKLVGADTLVVAIKKIRGNPVWYGYYQTLQNHVQTYYPELFEEEEGDNQSVA